MTRNKFGPYRYLDRSMAGKYLSRDTRRPPLPKARVNKAHPKRLFGCVGGPFDGNKIWLSGSDVTQACTLVMTIGNFRGRYVYDPTCDAAKGQRRVIWEAL